MIELMHVICYSNRVRKYMQYQ